LTALTKRGKEKQTTGESPKGGEESTSKGGEKETMAYEGGLKKKGSCAL